MTIYKQILLYGILNHGSPLFLGNRHESIFIQCLHNLVFYSLNFDPSRIVCVCVCVCVYGINLQSRDFDRVEFHFFVLIFNSL